MIAQIARPTSSTSAIAPFPSSDERGSGRVTLPNGFKHDRVSELFGELHRIYQGEICIGTFGKVGTNGDRLWINSKVCATAQTFTSEQSAADKLVQLWTTKTGQAIAA